MSFSSQMIEIFDYIGNKFGMAIDWTSDTVLPMLQALCAKYITWEICTSIVWMVLCLGIFFTCIAFFRSQTKAVRKRGDWSEELVVARVFTCIIMGIMTIPIVTQVFDIIRCVVFPELEIVQYLQHIATHCQ